MPPAEKTLSIGEAAKMLNRVPRTLRSWESLGWLPQELMPSRDERGRRVYTEQQVEHIREWMIAEDLRSGRDIQAARSAI